MSTQSFGKRTAMLGIAALTLLAAPAIYAGPINWELSDVTLSDGITVTGSFTFNADTDTYSNVDITTTAAGPFSAYTFLDTCGTDVSSCTGVSPNSTEALFLTSNASNQSGLPAIAFFFTGVGGVPPAGLTDAGGTIDISNSSLSVGAVQEAFCSNSACSSPAEGGATSTSGFVTTAPEPASVVLVGSAMLGLLALRRRITR